jgi:hypothetical protein
VVGAFTFVCGLIGLWLFAGRPDGVERTAFEFLVGLRRGLVHP